MPNHRSLPRPALSPLRLSVCVAAFVALLLGACGDDDDGATSVSETTAASTGGESTSSSTTGADDEATTTTTAAASDDDQVLELVERYTSYHADLGNPNDPADPLLRELFTGPMLARATDIVTNNAVTGSYYEGGYELEVLGVDLDDDAGVVRTCAHDQITKRAADGSVEIPPEPAPVEVDFQVARTDDGWRIAEVTAFEEDPCELG